MSVGRIIWLIVLAMVFGVLFFTGIWHLLTLFLWQHPMLGWLPLLAMIAVGYAVGSAGALIAARPTGGAANDRFSPAPDADLSVTVGPVEAPSIGANPDPGRPRPRPRFAFGAGLLAGIAVLLAGFFFTVISPRAAGLDQIDYEVVEQLPAKTQPRLLPRSGIRDDSNFEQSKEIHLVRDPASGQLLWTGEFLSSWLSGSSSGVVVQPVDDLVNASEVQTTGFEKAVAGIAPSTLKGRAYIKHPFSRIQYPVLVPSEQEGVIAMAPYSGYRGFPFKYPYLKGVLVYHPDGTLEDLSPEEAAARPELAATGRLFPETVAREQAEALSRSDEFEGKIEDGSGNKQPYLTTIDEDTTSWVTIINDKNPSVGVKAIVIADSTTGATQVWQPQDGERIISTRDVIARARALPLRWEERRCCDSDGNSYTVTLREVVEPRLAFKKGRPYYLVTVVPTDNLALARKVEFTLLLDASSGETLDQFDHVTGGRIEDLRLQAFFGYRGREAGQD